MPSSLTLERNVFKMISEVRGREERKREEVGEVERLINFSYCVQNLTILSV